MQNEWTPIEKIGNFWVKREDQSSTGSHKFRSLEYQISKLKSAGLSQAVLSSSGNAAISASKVLAQFPELTLFVFLSNKTPAAKLAAIKHSASLIPIISSRPLRLAKYAVKHFKLPDLRPSQDENASIGFRSLGFEIFEQQPDIDNIFSFATSFASLRGIATAYETLKELNYIQKIPQLFAVTSSGQLSGGLSGKPKVSSLPSVATCPSKPWRRGEQRTNRQNNLSTIDNSRQQWTNINISDNEIMSTRQKHPELDTSPEGIASFTAAEKIKPVGETLVIFTGKAWQDSQYDPNHFLKAEHFAEVDEICSSAAPI